MPNATIIDVAKHAGVSIKTVSRVINNVKTVKPQVRERVMRAIQKLDYHPNPSARGLGGNRSYLLGLLYDISCGYYATSVLAGAMERSMAAKYQIVMQPCDYNAESLSDDVCRAVRQSHADGVILTPPLSDLSAVTDAIESLHIPFVKIAPGKHTDTYRSVCTNDRQSCASMTEQLAALGHQRIGFIIGNPDHAAVMDRYRGYLEGLQSCGLKLDKTLVVQGYNSHASGVQCARKLLNVAPGRRPTAIFASNDEMAAGALTVAHSMGLGVPEDISIVGFDDIPGLEFIHPTLTTVRVPMQELGAAGVARLLHELDAAPAGARIRLHPVELVVRESTGPRKSAGGR